MLLSKWISPRPLIGRTSFREGCLVYDRIRAVFFSWIQLLYGSPAGCERASIKVHNFVYNRFPKLSTFALAIYACTETFPFNLRAEVNLGGITLNGARTSVRVHRLKRRFFHAFNEVGGEIRMHESVIRIMINDCKFVKLRLGRGKCIPSQAASVRRMGRA